MQSQSTSGLGMEGGGHPGIGVLQLHSAYPDPLRPPQKAHQSRCSAPSVFGLITHVPATSPCDPTPLTVFLGPTFVGAGQCLFEELSEASSAGPRFWEPSGPKSINPYAQMQAVLPVLQPAQPPAPRQLVLKLRLPANTGSDWDIDFGGSGVGGGNGSCADADSCVLDGAGAVSGAGDGSCTCGGDLLEVLVAVGVHPGASASASAGGDDGDTRPAGGAADGGQS
mmetsp:Transcript_27675/g.44206  ORF Transcript_27675/g.44206 Transcript_27675/m.44206 type:complete len:225 (-) Transcript_27675:1413-2087(-)